MKTKEYEVPTPGDSFQLLFSALILVPLIFGTMFWFCWTICHIGETYFTFLPLHWQIIPWFDCILLNCCGYILTRFFNKAL